MAGNWGSDSSSSDSDTETGEESLMENPLAIALHTIAQYQAPNMREIYQANPPREDEVIVVSSDDEETYSLDSDATFESTTSQSPSTASDVSHSPPLDNTFQETDPRLYLGEYLQTNSLVLPPVEHEGPSVPEAAFGESLRDNTSSPESFDIRETIEQRLPLVEELPALQVTLNTSRTITSHFPSSGELCTKTPSSNAKGVCVTKKDDSLLMKKPRKYDPTSPSVLALKRYQVSTISEAVWKPDERRAEVTLRRGKQLESAGSAGNPMFLEFYEALYLMVRVKLRLLSPERTPMTVLEAYDALLRNTDDSELYSIYEYLMDTGAIVTPFKAPRRPGTNHRDGAPAVEKDRAECRHSAPVAPPPQAAVLSAYKRDDSDSDLEVLSCNIPAASKTTDTTLIYEQGSPYEGPEISFPELRTSMEYAVLQAIPEELLPECRTVVRSGTSDVARIPVSGNAVELHPNWFTVEGQEELGLVTDKTLTLKRTRKRKTTAKVNAKSKKQKISHPDCDYTLRSDGFPEFYGDDGVRERYNRRWFPRWFDGVELGVHSLSIVDTLHKFTADGIPKIESAKTWSQYKDDFARLVKESCDQGESNCLYRGSITPLMTGTKKNQTQLIFGELQLTQEVSESSELRELLEDVRKSSESNRVGSRLLIDQAGDLSSEASTPNIIFDVFTDSTYSKTKPCTPDYRVVRLKATSVLKIRDLIKLSLEAGEATLLIAHVADDKVRVRQAMTFSIPRYN